MYLPILYLPYPPSRTGRLNGKHMEDYSEENKRKRGSRMKSNIPQEKPIFRIAPILKTISLQRCHVVLWIDDTGRQTKPRTMIN